MRLFMRILNRSVEFREGSTVHGGMRILFSVAVLLLIAQLAACSEKPQQLAASREPGWQSDNWQHQMRDRGQTQNESNRIAY